MSNIIPELSLYFFAHWFLIFISYSILGWCAEMVYCTIVDRKLCRDRGFLNGPLCPIYGCGAIVILLALEASSAYTSLEPREVNPFAVFIVGMILASIIEYIASFLMEKLFHMKWWDYSSKRFQINGRVCLVNSLLFGVGAVVVVEIIMPWMSGHSSSLTHDGTLALGFGVFGIFLTDCVMSVRSAVLIGRRLETLHNMENELAGKIEAGAAIAADVVADLAAEAKDRRDAGLLVAQERIRELQERISSTRSSQDFFERRMMRSFPRLKSPVHSESMKALRRDFISRANKKLNK